MKKIGILFFIGLLMGVSCYGINKKKIERISIKAMDFSIITFSTVDCGKFEKSFNYQYKVVAISDSTTLRKFLNIINILEPVDSTYRQTVDTRAKIALYSNTDTTQICVGNLSSWKDGEIYKTPKELVDFIGQLYVPKKGGIKK